MSLLHLKVVAVLLAAACLLVYGKKNPLQREDLSMNNCVGYSIETQDESYGSLIIDSYCNDRVDTITIQKAENSKVNGVYEVYGTSGGLPKYQKFLKDGSMVSIQIVPDDNAWGIVYKMETLYYTETNDDKPPKDGWVDDTGDKSKLRLSRKTFKQEEVEGFEWEPADGVIHETEDFEIGADGNTIPVKSKSILSPLIDADLGYYLRETYMTAEPFDSITIDNGLDDDILRKVVSAVDKVKSSEWIGPEASPGCCNEKYRLELNSLVNSKAARKLLGLTQSPRFIRFLEALSGEQGLIPMRFNDRNYVSLGTSFIGIERNGYLVVHNDFDRLAFNSATTNMLYRRVNVLLYLNEDWEDIWQGHFELWSRDAKFPVKRIPPIFNRMVIFTAKDDAFHGHPEPLEVPDGQRRLGVQFVYFTQVAPSEEARVSNRTGPSNIYKSHHTAIFQPTCTNDSKMKELCRKAKRDDMNETKHCECHNR
jgi:Rps23 Pro-64 3,4-dihydroxylase Tpa1-like proline 4-hydroxylase